MCMNYNDELVNIINKVKDLVNANEKYTKYMQLLNKLNKIVENLSNVSNIDENDIELFEHPDAIKYINGINYFYINGIHDFSEIKTAINWLKDRVIYILENNEELLNLKNKIISLDKMLEKINNDEIDETFLDFIKECYYNKTIDLETAIKLNLYIAKKSMNKVNEEDEELVVLVENKVSILEEIKEVFNKYGYDYNEINFNNKTRDRIERYANLEYLDYVLSILKENDITKENIEDRQLVIANIIICKEKDTLENILNFIKNNNCSLMELFEMGSIFHKRRKKFKFKDKRNGGGNPPEEEIISGDYESFIKNISLYKKYHNLPEDYKISKIDFENRTTFFINPYERNINNLLILETYGILKKGEFPKTSSVLTGSNVRELIDRSIETGLFEYCKKNLSFLEVDSKLFRWYKIKRAIDLGQKLIRGRGLRKELKDDSDLYGIKLRYNDGDIEIIQEQMTEEEIKKLPRKGPDDFYKRIDKTKLETVIFTLGYKYRTYSIDELFVHTAFSKITLMRIKSLTNKKEKFDSSFLERQTDKYIQLLDNAILNDKNDEHNCKIDERTYSFTNLYYPNVNVLISRYKVLNLVKQLKDNGMWINSKTNPIDIENLLLTVLLKDTVISEFEMNAVRLTIRNIINKNLEKIETERKGRI